MSFEHYMRSGNKMLRMGYTTGTCAALATQGAVRALLTGQEPGILSVMTGKGILVEIEPEDWGLTEEGAWCMVQKDGGDDADATHGMMVVSTVTLTDGGEIFIDGGEGVGRVTKPGLDQPVGNAAINRVPRQMIRDAALNELEAQNHEEMGANVIISIPGGEEKAQKTFNPMLGVVGGLSVLGTSGIVAPMSEQALIDTIEVEMKQKRSESADIILTPGNYGRDFLRKQGVEGEDIPVLVYSNFLGETLDMLSAMKFERVLLVGHIGKMVKVAGGVMNTHSRYADCRKEVFTAHAAVLGASQETCKALMDAATTDSCLDILEEANLRQPVLEEVIGRIQKNITRRGGENYKIGVVTFSNVHGMLGKSKEAEGILQCWNMEKAFSTPSV